MAYLSIKSLEVCSTLSSLISRDVVIGFAGVTNLKISIILNAMTAKSRSCFNACTSSTVHSVFLAGGKVLALLVFFVVGIVFFGEDGGVGFVFLFKLWGELDFDFLEERGSGSGSKTEGIACCCWNA